MKYNFLSFKITIATCILAYLNCLAVFAQDIDETSAIIINENNINLGETTACYSNCNASETLFIYDDGGENNYGINRDDTLTIYSTDLINGFISLKFLEMDIAPTDTLYIYNGSTTDPVYLTYQLGSLQTSWVNNSNIITLGEVTGLTLTAHLPNTTGAITLRFKTGNNANGTGFKLQVSCNELCQPFVINLEQMNNNIIFHPSEEPVTVLMEDGFHYINLCPQPAPLDNITDSITFSAFVSYPNNNFTYHQNNSTSLFIWEIGSEVISGYGLDKITKHFIAGNGATVLLTVIDTAGCVASNNPEYRIRSSKNPIKSISGLADANVCTGEQLEITFGNDINNSIILNPIVSGVSTILNVSDTILIPDGNNCPPNGYFVKQPITIDGFDTTDVIESVNDILSVCINIEHSSMCDLKISLECPNGQSAILLPDYQYYYYPSVGYSIHLGEGNKLDDYGDCAPASYSIGNGWNYCWSDNSEQGYVYSTSQYGFMYEPENRIEHNNVFHGLRNTVIPSNRQDMTQIYHPFTPFDYLIGCPLNGTWYIKIEDTWAVDNGFLFECDLNFSPHFNNYLWSYQIDIDSIEILGAFLNEDLSTNSSFVIEPPVNTPSGFYNYGISISDSYGCNYQIDSSFQISVHPTYETTVEPGVICQGDSYHFNGQNYYTSGIYYDTLQTIHGCDSVLELLLTVNPTSITNYEATFCQESVYTDPHFSNLTLPGIYCDTLQNIYGCDSIVCLTLNHVPNLPEQQICMVTVDENYHNKIVWMKQEPVESYNIYRESDTYGVYDLLTNIPYSESNNWVDASSNAKIRSYRYKISGIDTCNIESGFSNPHKTMHLMINSSINNSWELTWTPYEGINSATYNIYRAFGDNPENFEMIESIPYGNTSYTDSNTPDNEYVYYFIELVIEESCDLQKSTNTIKSNIVTNHPNAGIGEHQNITTPKIYPNPTNGKIIVNYEDVISIRLYDMAGKELISKQSNGKSELDISHLPNGVYNIKIVSKEQVIGNEKIIKK